MTKQFRLLVVEDDPAVRKLLHRVLSNMGYCIDLARDGSDGYRHWKNGSYDLVLTDCSMPGMNGFELAARIRGGERDAATLPIVAITGRTMKYERPSTSGIDDFIRKPIDVEELQNVLDLWLPQPAGDSETSRPSGIDDSSIMRSITKTFIRTLPDYLQALNQACAVDARTEIAAAAHKLKSAAGLVGGTEVAEQCHILEERAYVANGEEICERSEGIRKSLRSLGNALRSPD